MNLPKLIGDRLVGELLVGTDLTAQVKHHYQQLYPYQGYKPRVLIDSHHPQTCLAQFLAACWAGCRVFLADSRWGDREWQQVSNLVRPNLVWAGVELPTYPLDPPETHPPAIMLPTGGTSGQIRFVCHTWSSLSTAAQALAAHLEITEINSICILPLHHVSGLMQLVRALMSGGKLQLVTELWRILDLPPQGYCLSLVPTQLQKLLKDDRTYPWLRQLQAVFLGGAPAWPALLAQARQAKIPLAPTYGMTETAAQVATLRPAEFLAGVDSCGSPLPHVQVQIVDQTGQLVGDGTIGTIKIKATSLGTGYYPATPLADDTGFYQTDDLGWLDAQGHLHVAGRRSQTIITGGEKVLAQEVEQAILATGLVQEVAVFGVSDRYWGQVVTAVYVGPEPAILKVGLTGKIAKFKIPRRWVAVPQLPRNAQGKLLYHQLPALVEEAASLQACVPLD